MNILLCGDFAQLPPVGDSALYTLPLASKVSVAVIAGKAAYDAFTEMVPTLHNASSLQSLHQAGNCLRTVSWWFQMQEVFRGSKELSFGAFEYQT